MNRQAFLLSSLLLQLCSGLQSWSEQPSYQEVNPGGNVILGCVVKDMRGQCRWEKDGTPVGIYPGKYEWAGTPERGDCSLSITDSQLQYDDGVWQCQVTPSSFQVRDALISEGAQLVVRESPTAITIQKVGDVAGNITASAGEDVELECTVSGGNPPAKLRWWFSSNDKEITTGHTQENARSKEDSRTWVSTSRLALPVSRKDDGSTIRCTAEHPTLEQPLSTSSSLTIHYPPVVSIETSPLDYLEEEKDPVTLRCVSDSNPPGTVLWRKEGLNGVFSPDAEINFSPVTRHTAGTYSCTSENALGTSQPAYVELDVKFSPSILSVGPSKIVYAQMNQKAVLTCEAEGNPPPRYQWLQKLPTQEVLIRGYEKTLSLDNVTYEHQGEFVCKAVNTLRNEVRSVQSEPIRVEVSGAPQVMKHSAKHEVRVQNGEDATLEVLFCADPLPKQAWHLGDVSAGAGNNIILAAGTGHGRFVAESVRKAADREDCYISALRINGAHADDGHGYQLRLTNDHGIDSHTIHLVVKDYVTQESLIAVVVGSVLTLLLLILVVIYCCKSGKCCCSSNETLSNGKMDVKPTDLESEKTDVESTHSSQLSGFPSAIIPPDALYATTEKHHFRHQQQHHYIHDAVFNDSKESLRPDLIAPSLPSSNLNRTNSSSGELNTSMQQKVSYNDLCFPKTSNYGSMKKKKQHNVGVDCRLVGSVVAPQPLHSYSSVSRTYY